MKGIRALALLAVAGTVAAGCSATTHGTGFGPTYTTVSGLAAQLSHATTQLETVQGSLHLSAGPVDETGTFSETVDAGNVNALDAKYTVKAQGNTVNVHVIIVDDTLYVDRGRNGKPWVIATPDSSDPVVAQLAENIQGTLSQSGMNQYVTMVSAGQDLKVVGIDSVDGVRCVHYHVSIDTRSAAKKLPGEQGKQMQQAADAGVDTIPLEMWVDAQGRIPKLTDKVTTEQATATVELRMNHFNEKVSISAPPPDQVDQG